jgi:hypothetical protein
MEAAIGLARADHEQLLHGLPPLEIGFERDPSRLPMI